MAEVTLTQVYNPCRIMQREANMVKKTIVWMAAVAALCTFANGTQVRLLNLVEMVELADRIFWGDCLKVEKKALEGSGFTAVEYTFQVRQGLKGVASGETVVFRQVQSAAGSAFKVPGLPHFQQGEDALVFLHGDSRIGLTSPVGLTQGVFRVEESENGELTVQNSLSNSNLNHDLAPQQVRAAGFTKQEADFLAGGAAIPLESFKAMVSRAETYRRSSKEKSIE